MINGFLIVAVQVNHSHFHQCLFQGLQSGKCVHFQTVGLVYAFYLARREGTSLGNILEGPLPCELNDTEPTFSLPHSRQIRERKALFFLLVWGDCFWPDHVQFFGGWRGKIFVSKGVWKGKSFVSNVVWKGKNFVSLWMCKGKTLSQNGCVKAKTSFRKFVDKSHFEFLYLLQSQFHERPRSVKGSLCFWVIACTNWHFLFRLRLIECLRES